MFKQRKAVLTITVGCMGLVFAGLSFRWMLDSTYRKQLPALPDLQTVSLPLQEQISTAYRKAKLRPTAGRLGILGMVYHSNAYYDEAAQCYQLAIKKGSSHWVWNYYLGYLNREMGESGEAIRNFQAVLKKNSKAYHARYYIGEGYQNLNQNDKAEASFKIIVNLKERKPSSDRSVREDYFPLRTYAKYQLAQIYINTARIDEAEKALMEIIRGQNSFGPAYRLLGNAYSLKGDSALSRKYKIRAGDLLDFKPPVDTLADRLTLISRSDLYVLKKIDEAERSVYPDWALTLARNAMKNIPGNKYLLSKAIKLHLKMGSGKQALLYLNQHLADFSADFNELKETGNLLYDRGYYPESLNYYRSALKIKPEDPEVQASLVLAMVNAGDKKQAVDLLDEQVGQYKGNPKVLANAVYVMLTLQEKEKARSFLSQLRQLSPSGPKTYQLGGIMAEQDGKVQEAIILYASAIKGNPKDFVSIQSLSEILMRQRLWTQLIRHLEKALEYNPNEPYLLERLGTLLVTCPDVKLRDYSLGREYSERAFIHKASTPEIVLSAGRTIAEAYAALGDKNSARIYMSQILEMATSQNAPEEFTEAIRERMKTLN